jgi:hypothetical protein
MKVNLKLNDFEKKQLATLGKNNKLDLTLMMCYNYVQYFKLFNPTFETIIENTEYIFHGHCYDSDELSNYWLVLTRELELVDFAIPLNFDITKPDSSWNQILSKHQNVIKNVLGK